MSTSPMLALPCPTLATNWSQPACLVGRSGRLARPADHQQSGNNEAFRSGSLGPLVSRNVLGLPTSGVRRLACCASRIINLRLRYSTSLPGWALGDSLPGCSTMPHPFYVMTGTFASMRAPVPPQLFPLPGAQKQDGADSETWRFASIRRSKCDILVSCCTHRASYS